jgi:hypothetical protein
MECRRSPNKTAGYYSSTATCYCFLNTNLGANNDNLKCRICQCLPGLDYLDHKVHIYKEYHSVCPLVGIGTLPPPLSPASVTLPPEPKGGGTLALRVRGWGRGSPNSDDLEKSLALCLLCDSDLFVFKV